MDKEISREGAEAGAGAGQRNAYNVALHIGTKEIENVEMAKRKWAVSSRKAATRGLRSKLQLSSERNRLRGCPGDCFALFAFIDELSITKLYFRLLFFCFCLCSRAVCFLAFKDMTLNCSLAAWQLAQVSPAMFQGTFSSCATFAGRKKKLFYYKNRIRAHA